MQCHLSSSCGTDYRTSIIQIIFWTFSFFLSSLTFFLICLVFFYTYDCSYVCPLPSRSSHLSLQFLNLLNLNLTMHLPSLTQPSSSSTPLSYPSTVRPNDPVHSYIHTVHSRPLCFILQLKDNFRSKAETVFRFSTKKKAKQQQQQKKTDLRVGQTVDLQA